MLLLACSVIIADVIVTVVVGELELDHERQVVGGHVWVREADHLVALDPFGVQGTEETDCAQQLTRVEYVVDHALEVVSVETR